MRSASASPRVEGRYSASAPILGGDESPPSSKRIACRQNRLKNKTGRNLSIPTGDDVLRLQAPDYFRRRRMRWRPRAMPRLPASIAIEFGSGIAMIATSLPPVKVSAAKFAV